MGNMEMLKKCFNDAEINNTKWIVILIKYENKIHEELIINPKIVNPKDSFLNRLKYYENKYTDELILKSNKDISISRFIYANSISEIDKSLYN